MSRAIINNGWAVCPIHGIRLCRIEGKAVAKGIKLWCKQCKCEHDFDT